jgi:hypothetical protein
LLVEDGSLIVFDPASAVCNTIGVAADKLIAGETAR